MIDFTSVDLPPDHQIPEAPKNHIVGMTPEQFAMKLAGYPVYINPETPSGYADLRDGEGHIVKRVSLGRFA